MSPRWVRVPPTRRDDVAAALAAAALAAGVGAVAFYLTRLLLARQPLPDADEDAGEAPEAGGA